VKTEFYSSFVYLDLMSCPDGFLRCLVDFGFFLFRPDSRKDGLTELSNAGALDLLVQPPWRFVGRSST